MEEEFERTEFESSGPSEDDDLDRAIAEAEKAWAAELAKASTTEPEDEEDEGESDDTTNDDAPGGTDEDDDSEVVEANTPTEDENDVVAKPQESRKKNAAKQQGSEDEEDRPLSRKQRGKIIEEYRQELMASEEKRKRLEEQVAKQQAEEEILNSEISRALGTDPEYEKAVEDGLAGDTEAAEKARVWKANRAFYRKLVDKAGKTYQEEFAQVYLKTLQELPGIDMDVATGNDLAKIIQHVHEAGQETAEAKYKAQIEKLQRDVDTWKGRAKSQGPRAASEQRRSPLSGGGEPVIEKEFDWEKHYLDKDGLPTDEFESLVRRYGLEAVTSGKHFKRGK